MNTPSHTELLSEMRQGFAQTDTRLDGIERQIKDLGEDQRRMDERQRILVEDVQKAKGGLAVAKWLWAATLAVAGIVVAIWHRVTS